MRTSKTLLRGIGLDRGSARVFCARGWVRRLVLSQGRRGISLGGAGEGRRLQLLEEVRKINDTQREVFFNKVRSALWTLRGKRLAALGLAFKGDTDDIRESPAIEIIKKLLHAGAIVTAYDPAAMERAREVLPPAVHMKYAGNLYEAVEHADAVLILTDWKEFAAMDLARLNRAVRFPIIIDGRNLYKPAEMQSHGFTYVSVGRQASYQSQEGRPRKQPA